MIVKICLLWFTSILLMSGSELTDSPASDFIRKRTTKESTLLETAITTYQKNDQKITLIGAIHIAEESYYLDLQKKFATHDLILFEMIGGDTPKALESLKKPNPNHPNYQIAQALQLVEQTQKLNYLAPNFRHADLTYSEYQDLLNESKKTTSLLDREITIPDDLTTQLLKKNLETNDLAVAKNRLITIFDQLDNTLAEREAITPSILLTTRNQKALATLKSTLATDKPKHPALFFGAAHLPHLEKKIQKMGYKKTKQQWLVAWSVLNSSQDYTAARHDL